ncbi:MAG: hypothetical protein ACLGIR_03610 [Actinomycetes bacterium]
MTRSHLRRALVAALTGALTLGVAWAGAVVVPAPRATPVGGVPTAGAEAGADPAALDALDATLADLAGSGAEGDDVVTASTTALGPTGLAVGAARVSIHPRPEDYGGRWETDRAECATLSPGYVQELLGEPLDELDHIAHTGSPWPENPDCIYMGGFGIGPMNPVTAFDTELGLWVRAVALTDGEDTLVLSVIDAEGHFWEYGSKCDDCGAKQIAERLGGELGIDPAGIVIAATHAHSAPDLIGGWGFVPDWYMAQVTDAIEEAITTAVTTARPAVLEVGEERAREFNADRRDTYRSAEEQQVGWLRALATGPGGTVVRGPGGAPEVIATLGAYAAHPTRFGTNDGVAHPDWPGLFVRALEDRFGGVGMQIMTGLGNLSGAGPRETMGTGLAALLPPAGEGHVLTDTDVRFEQRTWDQPATNVPLTALGVPGFFDHLFSPKPAMVRTGKEPDTAPCVSSSPYSVNVPVTAAWVGQDLAITTGPGEVFANLTNTVKERSGARVTMPLGQANDSLGYIPQSFEHSRVGQQGLGFGAGGFVFVNYEDSYALDHCFGDMVLETQLEMLAGLR